MLAILFTTNQNHFLLFWPKDNLKGFGRHEDSIINGRGENPAVIKRDYELMRWVTMVARLEAPVRPHTIPRACGSHQGAPRPAKAGTK